MNEPAKTVADGVAEREARPLSLSDRVRSLRLPERPARSGPGNVWLPWTLCAVFAVIAIALAVKAFSPAPVDAGKKDDLAQPGPKTSGTAAAIPGKALGPSSDVALESKGYIIPVHQIQVSPKVSGMVLELFIEEDMRVKEGDILAKVETTEYQADHDRALGMTKSAKHRWQELWKYRDDEIKQAKAELEDTKAQRDHLYLEWKRNASLKNTKAVSASEYDSAESAYKSMEFRLQRLQLAYELLVKGPRDERIASAKADWEQAEADLMKAKWRLDNCTVRAPVSGTILKKRAEKGNMVNPAAFSNGLSASLCDMADLSDMEVELSIAERDIGKIFVEQKCKIRAEAFPERIYEGIVTRILPIADRAKGAVPVRVKIFIPREEEGQFLRPEMGALVTFFNKK